MGLGVFGWRPSEGIRAPLSSLANHFFFGLGMAFTPLFILVNVWELKSIEEPELEKHLGEDYIEYQRTIPMFFPGFERIFKRRR
jgi:protein-S-isoprenylcysteine O-methyltransferase Ste14